MHSGLEGKIVLRFTYSFYEGGGGLERYLADLNRELINANRMTVIQICLTKIQKNFMQKVEQGRLGQLVHLIMPYRESQARPKQAALLKRSFLIAAFKKSKKSFHDYLMNFSGPAILVQKLERAMNYTIPSQGGFDYREFKKLMTSTFGRYQIDLIMMHTHDIFEPDLYLIRESIRRKIPFAFQIHFHNKLFNLLSIRENIQHAHGIAGVSNRHIPKYIKGPFYNLSDGVDVHFYKKAMVKEKTLAKEPLVFLPARMTSGKGHLDLIKAAQRMKKKKIDFKIICAGRCDMPEFELRIRHLLKTKNLSDFFILLNHLSQEELREIYAQSHVVVLPSTTEGLPRVLLEAQAMELPVIAYNTGGAADTLRNHETGFLIRKGDFRALAKRIIELLADENKRKQMGAAGRKFIEKNYSVEAMAKRHEAFYAQMMQK